MKRLLIICPLLLLLFAASCKKQKDSTPDPGNTIDPIATPVYPDYSRLKPGNYWIYMQYALDSATDPGTPRYIYDSCYVEKDTAIRGHTYHKYCAPDYGNPSLQVISYLRDSTSCIVNNYGHIVFSSDDFIHVFDSTWYINPAAGIVDTAEITYQMDYKDKSITVPAGTYKTSTFRKIYHLSQSAANHSPDVSYDYSYAEQAGLVKATIAIYGAQYSIERRLVRYHLQ